MKNITKIRVVAITKIHVLLAVVLLTYQNCAPFHPMVDNNASVGNASAGLNTNYAYGKTGLRRLTSYEVVNSVSDVFGVDASAFESRLPSDERQNIPFSNETGTQAIAPVTIENYQTFSEEYSSFLVTRPDFATRFANQAGCAPQSASDRTCLIQFMMKVGGKIMRRPFTIAEAERNADLFIPIATAEKNFKTAVELTIQTWLQHPEFLYRIEAGGGAMVEPGLVALTDYEIATELSFLIWGSTPDDALLEKARLGQLKDPNVRVAEATRLFASARARGQWQRFHAQWLGYESPQLPANLASDMTQESNMLVDRILFVDQSDWLDLFRLNETYVTPALATQYGMTGVTKPGWIKYAGARGGGILAHASFLAQGAKFGDTSPTRRGYEIFKRVMCGKLGPIPDDVDTDVPPGSPTDCKPKRYFMRSATSCAGCHTVTDNIGFGLENFGVAGEWRTTEPNNPSCVIDNAGSVGGASFSGPAGLGELLATNDKVSQCAVTQLFRFFSGRPEAADDQPMLNALNSEYQMNRSLKSVIVAMVGSPGFAHRVK